MTEKQFLFGKKNYILMGVGLALIAIGYLLMAGGASTSPDTFNEEMFSTMRIRIAPLVVITGFIVEIWAILAKK
ncbi:MAG: DUF3098 domain-containing protein [Flavobacteriales bacterium]|nr:DUF3098 domain-containing protein [Flavobacteriales bacterium]